MYGKACGLSEPCDIVAGLYRIDRGKVHFSSPPDKFRYPQAQKAACLFLQAGGLYDLRRKCGPAVPLHRVYRIADPRFLLSLLLPWARFAAAVFLLENSLLFAHGEDGGRNSLHDRISFREFQFLYALYHTFSHLSFNLWLKFFLRQAVFFVCFPDAAVCLHQRPKRMSFLLKTTRKNLDTPGCVLYNKKL